MRCCSNLSSTDLSGLLLRMLYCVIGFGVFQDATSENTALALRWVTSRHTMPAPMLSDNGRYFAGGKIGGPKKRWTATAFEEKLLANNILLMAMAMPKSSRAINRKDCRSDLISCMHEIHKTGRTRKGVQKDSQGSGQDGRGARA